VRMSEFIIPSIRMKLKLSLSASSIPAVVVFGLVSAGLYVDVKKVNKDNMGHWTCISSTWMKLPIQKEQPPKHHP